MSKKTLDRVTVDKSVVELAAERMKEAYERFDHVAVMFSGGKDSTACLHVALDEAHRQGRLPLDVVFIDEEAIPIQTEDYVRRVAERDDVSLRWYCIPVKHRNACSRLSPWWYPWDPDERDKWVRPLPPEAITDLPGFKKNMTIPYSNGLYFPAAEYGSVGMVMGIRAQESLTRLRAVTRRLEFNYIVECTAPTVQNNVWKVYPIYDWTDNDVWTAPHKFGWDYNTTYDALEMAGVSIHNQRCSPPYGEEPLEKLWTYKVCFPEIWGRMADRVPGANTAVTYARTELYGYRGTPQKPADMPWEDFLLTYVKKHPPSTQRMIARRLRSEIQLHYKKTADPIMEHAPHPDTGISWTWLLLIAMRGDYKSRKQAGGRIDTNNLERVWERCNKEREACAAS